ncbi:MAG: tetratricopeptide repeat protein, partial [Nitrospirota bacterium]
TTANTIISEITLIMICFIIMSGCALPRIVILDDPLTPEEHINLGVAYEKQGELDNALREYEKASKKLPVALLYMGNVYFERKDFEKAEKYYRQSIKKDANNADAYNNLAWLYYTKKENLEEAEEFALKAMELNPEKGEMYRDTLEKIISLRKER